MKYEMVFGDDKLFNGATDDVVLVSVQLGDFRYFTEENLQACKKFNIYKLQTCDTQLAMRRIIRTPTWTVADWKAGKLPEVGCLVEYFANNSHLDTKITAEWMTGDVLEVLQYSNKFKAFSVFICIGQMPKL